MDSTSTSLLRRLRKPNAEDAWRRFVFLYTPLIYRWARNNGFNSADSSDLVQAVFAKLLVKLPEFEYDPSRRFRAWLITIVRNQATDYWRRAKFNTLGPEGIAEKIPDSFASEDFLEEREYRAFLVSRARQLMETEFEPLTWQACWKYVAEGQSAADAGRELGISANAVRVAKCRVLRRLRQELAGLLD